VADSPKPKPSGVHPSSLPVSSNVTNEDRAAARIAVAECLRKRYPGARTPHTLDDADVECVAQCAAAVPGELHAKLQALRDSLEGALCVSRQPPTVRYIWGTLEHFQAHSACGRRLRLGARAEPRGLNATSRGDEPKERSYPGGADPVFVAELLDGLFGSGWRTRKC
jgi:hypothetical protein